MLQSQSCGRKCMETSGTSTSVGPQMFFKQVGSRWRTTATPQYLDQARKEYRQNRTGWFVGQSPPGVPCVTPAEARAHSLKLVTQHKLHGIREFLKDVLPRMGTQWAQSCEQLSGRGMQPTPWMWQ